MGDYESQGNYRNQGGQVGSSEQTNHGDNEKQENRQVGPRGPQDDGRLQEPREPPDHGNHEDQKDSKKQGNYKYHRT